MILKPIKSLTNTYNKLSNWGKILIFIVLLLFVVVIFRNFKVDKKIEGFEQNDEFLMKTDTDVYDNFYSNIYDYLVYNNVKNDYEIGEIINKTEPTSQSLILDVGSGTGHHTAALESRGFRTVGIDKSVAMVNKAKSVYPQLKFVQGDVLNSSQFNNGLFTHILCLYFTLYYIKDKSTFFRNCYQWLKPGGYLVIHVVNREMFDPILPPGNPLLLVSVQKYAKNFQQN
jgi:SAM-dependent methyltransferase